MKNYPFIALALLFLFTGTSCSLEERLERREERIIGTWAFDNARFRRDGAVFGQNVFDDFRGDRMIFFEDFTVEYDDANGDLFFGIWEMTAIRDDDDTEFLIDLDFFDVNGLPAFNWIGTITRLTRRDFNMDVDERNGRFRFRLDRVE